WQANAAGRYDHPDDTRDTPLDPHFRGFGRVGTDEQGRFRFRTIKPGPVPGAGTSRQAPHINVSVFARGLLKRLVTRIYFPDVEAALARAQAKLGLVPARVAAAITAAARVENVELARLAASTRTVGYPVVSLVKELSRVAGDEAARYIHLGATTQDILDTAFVLQLRQACGALRRDLLALAR